MRRVNYEPVTAKTSNSSSSTQQTNQKTSPPVDNTPRYSPVGFTSNPATCSDPKSRVYTEIVLPQGATPYATDPCLGGKQVPVPGLQFSFDGNFAGTAANAVLYEKTKPTAAPQGHVWCQAIGDSSDFDGDDLPVSKAQITVVTAGQGYLLTINSPAQDILSGFTKPFTVALLKSAPGPTAVSERYYNPTPGPQSPHFAILLTEDTSRPIPATLSAIWRWKACDYSLLCYGDLHCWISNELAP